MTDEPTKAPTYRDGIGVERCAVCQSAIRAIDGAPVIMLRAADVEALACFVARELEDRPAILARLTRADDGEDLAREVELYYQAGRLLLRLTQAAGRTVAQMRAAPAEAIPANVKTDRAGLADDEA